MARLGDYIKQIRGVSYKPEDLHSSLDENSIMLLRANNIQDGKLCLDDVVYVDKSKVRPDQLLKKGDILICTSSGSKDLVGKAAYVEEDANITFGAFCKVVRPIANYPRYIGHFFNSKAYRDTISAISAGVNINNIRGEHIDELRINMPSLDEQRKIATELDKVDNVISLRKKQLQKLDDLIKSRFIEMFGDPVSNPKKLPSKKLSSIASLITKGASPSWQGYSYTDDPSQTLFVTSENVREGVLDLSEPKYLEDGFNEKQGRSMLKNGDFLINIVGASIGRAARFDRDCKANINQAVALVRMGQEEVLTGYMLFYLNSPKALEMYSGMKSDVARANLTLQNIGDLEIIIPLITEQQVFSRFLQQSDKSKLIVQQGLEKLEQMKQALMQKYFG